MTDNKEIHSKVHIRKMKNEEIPQIAEMLGRAFAPNPEFLIIYRNKSMKARHMQNHFESGLKHGPAKYFVAELNGRIVGGVKVTKAPDCGTMDLKAALSFVRTVGGLGPLMRFLKFLNAWGKQHPKQPHWHLMLIGIEPEFQHKGIGGQLMTFYCALIDQDGIEAYHEADRRENVPFYERYGFKVVGEEMISGARIWYMLRDAKGNT
ncbi:MAG: GNAT family N-acetyltransferase [Halobacteriota archaeon]